MPHQIIAYENEKIEICDEHESCKDCEKYGTQPCCGKCSKQLLEKLIQLRKDDSIDAVEIDYKNNTIKCSSYTGYFQLDDVEFVIYPKIDKEDPENGSKIFWNLVGATDEFKCIRTGTNSATTFGTNKLIKDIIIKKFCSMMDTLIKKGIKKFYSPEEDNLPYLKGKIKFSEHIKHNIASKEKFYCEYDEFTDDIPENRILKLACQEIFKTTNEENRKSLRKYIQAFGDIEDSKNLLKDFARIQPNRMYQHYDEPLNYAEVFLNHKYFWPRRGKKKFPAVLFQLYDLFENYVEKLLTDYKQTSDVVFFIKKQFKESGSDKNNKKENYLFPDNKMFKGKMDFLLRDKNKYEDCKKFLILDTKYKLIDFSKFEKEAQDEEKLEEAEKNKYEIKYNQTHITVGDLYQVLTYSEIIKNNYKKGANNKEKTPEVEIALLYPQTKHFKEKKKFTFFNGTKITFIPVNLTVDLDKEPSENKKKYLIKNGFDPEKKYNQKKGLRLSNRNNLYLKMFIKKYFSEKNDK